MTMSEFNIRFFAYKRLQRIEKEKIFEINRIIIGSSLAEKKAKTELFNSTKKVLIQQTSKPKIPQFVLDRFKQQREEYLKRKKEVND
jgi:hypothetical protein